MSSRQRGRCSSRHCQEVGPQHLPAPPQDGVCAIPWCVCPPVLSDGGAARALHVKRSEGRGLCAARAFAGQAAPDAVHSTAVVLHLGEIHDGLESQGFAKQVARCWGLSFGDRQRCSCCAVQSGVVDSEHSQTKCIYMDIFGGHGSEQPRTYHTMLLRYFSADSINLRFSASHFCVLPLFATAAVCQGHVG